jgi:toxin ParE1/3/4
LRRNHEAVGKVRYTRRARRDLLEIWEWIASDNPSIADRVYDAIEVRCGSLRSRPQLGRPRPEVGEGARSLVIKRWIAFYRIVGDGVQVVRIVDGARDLTKLEWTLE